MLTTPDYSKLSYSRSLAQYVMNHLMYMLMRLVVRNPRPYTTAQSKSPYPILNVYTPSCFVQHLDVQQNCVRRQQLVITDNLRLQTIREHEGYSFPKSCSPQLQPLLACSTCSLHLQELNMPTDRQGENGTQTLNSYTLIAESVIILLSHRKKCSQHKLLQNPCKL